MATWAESDGKDFYESGPFGRYVFPIEHVIDPSLKQYGRMEWSIEPIVVDGVIVEVIASSRQTTDPRYVGKIFRLKMTPCPRLCPEIIFDDERRTFAPWAIYPCTEHNTIAFEAYVPDGAKRFIIEAHSGIMNRIYFSTQEED